MNSEARRGRRLTTLVVAALVACSSDPAGVRLEVDRPAALFAEALSLTSVRLSWPRNPNSDVLTYLVQRREHLTGEFRDLVQVSQAASDSVLYFDGTVEPETIYGYRVIAIDRFGDRSRPSVVAGVATPYHPGIEFRVTTTAAAAGFTDPDGYTGFVGGPDTALGAIGTASPGVTVTRRFSPLHAGSYRAVLRNLSPNCEFRGDGQNQSDSSRTVAVTDQGVQTLAIVTYSVSCRDPSRGEIVVRVTVTGGDVDSSGFSLVATGQAADQTLPDSERVYYRRQPLTTLNGGTLVFDNLRVGAYQVEIDSVAATCSVQGERIKPVDITALALDTVAFTVDCPLGDVPDVPDPARPYVIRTNWTPASGTSGSATRLDLRTDFPTGSPLAVGDVQGITSFDPTVVRLDSIVAPATWALTPNIQSGAVAWLLLTTSPVPLTTADLVRLYFTAVGDSGTSVRTTTQIQSLSDAEGNNRSDSVRVVDARFRVTGGGGGGGGGNLPPTAEANGPYSGTVGTPIAFSAAGSTDPDGTLVSYSWNWGDQSAPGSGAAPTRSFATAGVYTVTLTVTDDDGATDTDQATVTVVGGSNQPPVAEANGPYTGVVGSPITLSAAGSSDPDGSITAYEWTFGDNTTGTGASPAKIYAAPGIYTATLTVRDNTNATDTDQATVTVTAPPPTGPLIWRSAFGAINPADSLVQLVITYDLTADIPETTGPEAVGTVIIDSLKWNPALLTYAAFNWGPGFSGSVNATGASTSGRIRFSAAQGNQGASGVVTIATITFKAIGPVGNTAGTSTFLGGISSSVASGAVAYLPHTGVQEGFLTLTYTGPQSTGTVSGTVTVTGQATSLAGVGFTIDPAASGAATVIGTLTGSGTPFDLPATTVQLGASGAAGFGAGQVTLGSLPTGCSVTSPGGGAATYSGLTAGGSTTVSFTVDCQTAPPPVQRYVYRSTWGAISGGTVDLTISFDPSGFNDPAINGAGPDGFSAVQAITTLTGPAAGRLTAVGAIAVPPFATPTVGGTLPNVAWLTNTTSPDRTALASVASFRFTIGPGAPGAVTTQTTVQDISTGNGDAFTLVLSGPSQNLDVVEATLALP